MEGRQGARFFPSISAPLGDMVGMPWVTMRANTGHTRKSDQRRVPRNGNEVTVRDPSLEYPETKIRGAVRTILHLLAEKQFEALADLTAPGPEHLQAEDIRQTMERYSGLVRVPDDTELRFDVVEVEGKSPRQFSVDAPIFTVEEGRSDLTARMTVTDKPGDDFEIVFYDVWVM